MSTLSTVNKIKQDASDFCSAFLVRTDKNPIRVVTFGYLKSENKWRMNISKVHMGFIVSESNVDSINCNELLDKAFEVCENTNAKLNIVVDEKDARFY